MELFLCRAHRTSKTSRCAVEPTSLLQCCGGGLLGDLDAATAALAQRLCSA